MIKELLQDMFLLKERGYYKQAIEILYKLLEMVETEEETNEIVYELAEVYFFSGNIERAVHYLEKLLESAPNHIYALRLQIKLLSSEPQKRILIAKKLYKLTNKPEDLKLYLALLNKAGEYKETSGYIDTTVENYCCQEIAEALYALGDYRRAKELLERQESLSEINELLLAKICYAINDSNSLMLLETRLAESKNLEVVKFIIRLEYDLMNYAKVIELAQRVGISSLRELFYIVGQAHLFKKQAVNAKKMFNLLCEQDSNPKFRFALALAYIEANQTSLAIEAVQNNQEYLKLITFILNEKSISKNVLAKEFISMMGVLNSDELALFKVIDICFKRNILSVVAELLKLSPEGRNLRYDFYKIKLQVRNKLYAEAEETVMNYRSNEAFAMLYAELLDSLNKFKELEELLENRPGYEENEFEQCCYYYARIFESKGENERAIDIALKGLDFVNDYAEKYYTLLYGLYKRVGEDRTALDCLEKAAKYNPELRPQLIREAAML